MSEPIKFYRVSKPFGAFSNFSKHSVLINDEIWATSEHYYQAQKFDDPGIQKSILVNPSPRNAANIGRDKSNPIRKGWDYVKDNVMRIALRAKFTQHKDLKELLLSTGDVELIEDSPTDYYWGCGEDGSGKNKLGVLLMELRGSLKNEAK